MSVKLVTLFPALKSELNPLGGPEVITDDDEEAGVLALIGAFWTAKATGGWFPDHRINVEGTEIVNVNGGDDLSREEQQIAVLFAALTSLEAQWAQQATSKRSKAGPNEVERTNSATVIRGIIDSKRARLDSLIEQMRLDGRDSAIGVYDMAAMAAAGRDSWIR